MAMNTNVVVTCAVTGAGDTVDKHPAIPITPEQIANSAIEAADAGAAIVHLHVRDPQTGKGSRDIALFQDVVERVRNSGRNVLINLTAGMGGDLIVDDDNPQVPGEGTDLISAEQRMAHVELLRPDIATLDCGTINFDNANYVYIQTPNMLRAMAARYAEIGVKPEMEVFDLTILLWTRVFYNLLYRYDVSKNGEEKKKIINSLKPLYFARSISFNYHTWKYNVKYSEMEIRRSALGFASQKYYLWGLYSKGNKLKSNKTKKTKSKARSKS